MRDKVNHLGLFDVGGREGVVRLEWARVSFCSEKEKRAVCFPGKFAVNCCWIDESFVARVLFY